VQLSGLRQAWQYEDFIWGIYLNKYIFRGADASTPLWNYIRSLERAGFEVKRYVIMTSRVSRATTDTHSASTLSECTTPPPSGDGTATGSETLTPSTPSTVSAGSG
jgi:hypothetical protein